MRMKVRSRRQFLMSTLDPSPRNPRVLAHCFRPLSEFSESKVSLGAAFPARDRHVALWNDSDKLTPRCSAQLTIVRRSLTE